MSALILLSILLPLFTSGAVLVPSTRTVTLRLAPLLPLPAFVLALLPYPGEIDLPWLLLGTRLGLDETGRMFLVLTALVWLISGWFAKGYLQDDPRKHWFWAFFLAAQAGNIGLCLAHDAASFYMLFALMTFSAYGLVVHTGTAEAFRAGRVYLVMAVLGEAALVAGILFAVGASGEYLLSSVGRADMSRTTAALLLAGFGIKVGLPLLHVWLPLAHPVAPVPASAVLSGVMLKAGLLGWLRFLPLGTDAFPEAGPTVMIAGMFAMFYGIVVGLTQTNVKVLLAYSSVSQMGFMTLGVGAGLFAPALWDAILPAVALYAVHHALAKGALFLGTAVVKSRPGTATLIGLALPALALSGMPFTSGALVKTSLKYALADLPTPWPHVLHWLLPLAAVGTALLLTRFIVLCATQPRDDHHRGLLLPWLLMLIAVTISCWLLASDGNIAHTLDGKALAGSAWPVLAAIVLYILAKRKIHLLPTVPPGDLLVPIEHLIAIVKRLHFHVPALPRRKAHTVADRAARIRLENAITRWPVAGTLWLLLLLVLGALLAGLTG